MSNASIRRDGAAHDRTERLQPWTAALLTALLHLLLLLLAMWSPPVTVTSPQGSAAGSSLDVTWIDQTLAPPPSPAPPTRAATPRAPATPPPAASRVVSTPVVQADAPVPPEAPATSDSLATSRATEPVPPTEPPPLPADMPDAAAQPQAQVPVANPPPPTQRPARMRGQPPGMRMEDLAPVNAGAARTAAVNRGQGNNASASGTNLEVDGYQVHYQLRSEARLRAWRDQGITELFLPLPGTRRYMVCPLEIALRRGSGECRMVQWDSPELATIGDAREVIFMQRVSRLGEVLWRGPGPYR